MASGQYLKSHKPMWPEYDVKLKQQKEALGLEGNKIFDSAGSITPVRGYEDIRSFLETNSCVLFTDSFDDMDLLSKITEDTRNKVICDKNGRPVLIRVGGLGRNGRSTTWIVRPDSWGSTLSPTFLCEINDLYKYCAVDSAPTPSSLGHTLMKSMQPKGKRHTSLNIACEKFIREHRVGGIVQTPGIGKEYPEALELDMASAYLSTFTELPTGTPIIAASGRGVYNFKTFFMHCTVVIKNDLPLGPFPIINGKGKVQWPTKKGMYDAYLWKFQVEDCIRAGCDVSLQRGWAWERIATDTLPWSTKMYGLRIKAPTDFIEKSIKACSVSAIGHHAMGREMYELVTEDRISGPCRPLIDSVGDCYNLWIAESYNWTSAIMVHWNNYCISMCNSVVYNFAKPFAEDNRLLAIDYDAILITEKDETHSFVRKKSIDSLQQRPGTWMWTKLHNVRIDAHRAYVALEHSKQPGLQKHHALDKHMQLMYT
jgi:hypothetical protein